jgi:hypothetical protein
VLIRTVVLFAAPIHQFPSAPATNLSSVTLIEARASAALLARSRSIPTSKNGDNSERVSRKAARNDNFLVSIRKAQLDFLGTHASIGLP